MDGKEQRERQREREENEHKKGRKKEKEKGVLTNGERGRGEREARGLQKGTRCSSEPRKCGGASTHSRRERDRERKKEVAGAAKGK